MQGFRITIRHFFKKKVTMQYPEEKWTVPEGYRGAPFLVKDPENRTKCVSCQLCEFICPPKAIRITPPGLWNGNSPEARQPMEKAPQANLRSTLLALQSAAVFKPGKVCPGRGDFPDERLFAHRSDPEGNGL